jgi:hypothetical protein
LAFFKEIIIIAKILKRIPRILVKIEDPRGSL